MSEGGGGPRFCGTPSRTPKTVEETNNQPYKLIGRRRSVARRHLARTANAERRSGAGKGERNRKASE
jgi:hypothetical protein